jgi:hypothetical protein
VKSFIAAFIGLGFSYIGMAAAAEQTLKPTIAIVQPSVDELVEYFDTIVFGSEFSSVKASTHVKKWRHPLRVVVKEYGEVVSYDVQGKQTRKLRERHIKRLHFDYIQKHLDELAFLTGLKLKTLNSTARCRTWRLISCRACKWPILRWLTSAVAC